MDVKAFLAEPKGLLIAPAGFGKTHFIADAFKHLSGKQLILTHTHAGVASIKNKLSKNRIASERFQVETISSLAQHFTIAFDTSGDLPDQEDKANYFPYVIKRAAALLERKHIAQIITDSYDGLFVDEYQDCSVSYHNFILKLADLIPTRFLGDPLQGIFEFKGETLVDLCCPQQMAGFIDNHAELDTPNRWKKGGNLKLGEAIGSIRKSLEKGEDVNLKDYPSIKTLIAPKDDFYNQETDSRKIVWNLDREENVLVLHPNSTNVEQRKRFLIAFQNRFHLIESFDDPAFYTRAREIDEINTSNLIPNTHSLLSSLFGKSKINDWVKPDRLVSKSEKNVEGTAIFHKLTNLVGNYQRNPHVAFFHDVINVFARELKFPCYRIEILWALTDSINVANEKNISVLEAMKLNRNRIRRIGRSVKYRSIGTTLLTKGLEFDTVLILNCHLFTCPKNFYVAISRACKKLIIFTENPVLSPYGDLI